MPFSSQEAFSISVHFFDSLIETIDFKILFNLYKGGHVHGIFAESEKMGSTPAIRTAKAGDLPISNAGNRCCQTMLQILCRADRNTSHPVCFLPKPVNMPVHAFPKPAMAGHSLIQVLCRRTGIDIISLRKTNFSLFPDFHVLGFIHPENQEVISSVSRFLVQNIQRRRKKPHAFRHIQVRGPSESCRLPIYIGSRKAECFRKFRVGMVIRKEPLRPVPLDQNQQPCFSAVFPDFSQMEHMLSPPSGYRIREHSPPFPEKCT